MQSVDNETGEVLPPRMPPEIAEAVFKVRDGIKQLGFDEDNKHAGYKYTSIDKFYIALRPLEAEAGLEIMLDETGLDVRTGDSGKSWVFINYDVWLLHRSGIMWGPLRRHIAMPVTGPQAFGAAESYILKAFRRGFYMVPTGEKDADDTAPRDDAPTGRAEAPGAQGKLRQHLSGGNGASALPTAARDRRIQGEVDMAMVGLARPTGPPATSPAEARFKEIRAEIDAAFTIDELNATGLWRETREADEALLSAVKFKTPSGETTAWDRLVERDTSKRMILFGAKGDIVA